MFCLRILLLSIVVVMGCFAQETTVKAYGLVSSGCGGSCIQVVANGKIYKNEEANIVCEFGERCVNNSDKGTFAAIIADSANYLSLLFSKTNTIKYFRYSDVPTTVGGNTSGEKYNSGGSSGGDVHVKGYYRKDGTYVAPHTRKKGK